MWDFNGKALGLKFTPLEFETVSRARVKIQIAKLKFTPLEFETPTKPFVVADGRVKIYSVGV